MTDRTQPPTPTDMARTRARTQKSAPALFCLAFICSFGWTSFMGASVARAQESASEGASKSAGSAANSAKGGAGGKRTQINFEDQLVEGQAQKPELFYLLQQRNANFKRLIRLREDFLPEMRKTADEIQRKGTSR